MIKQTITDFYRVAQERDFARDNQYRILNITTEQFNISEEDLLYAKSGEVPGRQIVNHTAPYMGLDFNVPGTVKYPGTFQLRFYCDSEVAVRRMFEAWSFNTFNEETSSGDYFVPKPSSILDMVQVNPQFEPIARYQLIGIYPTEIGNISYDIANGTGAPVEMNVTLQYHFWKKLAV